MVGDAARLVRRGVVANADARELAVLLLVVSVAEDPARRLVHALRLLASRRLNRVRGEDGRDLSGLARLLRVAHLVHELLLRLLPFLQVGQRLDVGLDRLLREPPLGAGDRLAFLVEEWALDDPLAQEELDRLVVGRPRVDLLVGGHRHAEVGLARLGLAPPHEVPRRAAGTVAVHPGGPLPRAVREDLLPPIPSFPEEDIRVRGRLRHGAAGGLGSVSGRGGRSHGARTAVAGCAATGSRVELGRVRATGRQPESPGSGTRAQLFRWETETALGRHHTCLAAADTTYSCTTSKIGL
mmetsp:Transcript_8746/g.36219  ORF Transcript_8746/g.36219 Transcript_8746/m.36219 type:complete len:297 (+) Transcript_8746:2257-3147(+)